MVGMGVTAGGIAIGIDGTEVPLRCRFAKKLVGEYNRQGQLDKLLETQENLHAFDVVGGVRNMAAGPYIEQPRHMYCADGCLLHPSVGLPCFR